MLILGEDETPWKMEWGIWAEIVQLMRMERRSQFMADLKAKSNKALKFLVRVRDSSLDKDLDELNDLFFEGFADLASNLLAF